MKFEQPYAIGRQYAQFGKSKWSVARLIELAKDLPVQEAPLDAINVYNKLGDLTLRELAMHVKAVNEADLQYPIILDEDGEIMDGRHRVVRAMIEEKKMIKFVRFDENPPPCCVDDD